MNIILLAPPGAGKGTQAELLKEKYALNHISTGELLRNVASRDDELGETVRNFQKNGMLVTDEIVFQVLKDYLDKSVNKDFLFDGFPRNKNQAEVLDSLIENIDYVFYLDVGEPVLESRMVGRRMCSECGSVYNINIDSLKPKKDSICDKCGGGLYQRSDDNKESFKVRYQEYLEKAAPLIDYYQNRKILYKIDSERTKEEVFLSICKIIEKR